MSASDRGIAAPFSRNLVVMTAAALTACTPQQELSNLGIAPASDGPSQIARGLAFVEAQCSGCHGVRPRAKSPNPQAPSFVAVANDMDFDQETLRDFFRDGHDTPDAMSIKLDEAEAEMTAAYIMSLRSRRR